MKMVNFYMDWTNGAISATIPLTTIAGMNNRGDVVGASTNIMLLYCSGNSPYGPLDDNTTSIPVDYFPTAKWNAGTLSLVGPVPTQHPVPVYLYSAGLNMPPNPLTTTPPGSQITSFSHDDIQTSPVFDHHSRPQPGPYTA